MDSKLRSDGLRLSYGMESIKVNTTWSIIGLVLVNSLDIDLLYQCGGGEGLCARKQSCELCSFHV